MARRILVVHRHPLFVEALTSCISDLLPDAEIVNAHDTRSAATLLRDTGFAGIILDLSMSSARGLNALIALRIVSSGVPIIVFADTVSGSLADSARACGGAALVPKTATKKTVLEVLASVLTMGTTAPSAKQVLSKAQLRVLQLMSDGLLNKQIAYELSIGVQTVKAHVTQILRKLDVTFRTQAVVKLTDVECVRCHVRAPVWRGVPYESLDVSIQPERQAAA